MREAKQLLHLPVVSIASGRQLGQVHELLFEPGRHALFGLVVKPEDEEPRLILERSKIRSVGQDAVTVDSESSAEVFDASKRAREVGAIGRGHLEGMTVLNEAGDVIGKVDNVILNDDLSIASYHASKGFLGLGSRQDIKPDEIVSAGPDAIVVRS